MTRRIVTRPGALAPGDAGDDATDRAAAQDQDVVDHEPERVQARRTNRTNRANGAGQLFHDDEADRDDDAVPNGAAGRPDEAGERSPSQQCRERQQALRDELTPMTTKEQGAADQLNDHREHHAEPGGEPIDPPPGLRPRHGTRLSLPDVRQGQRVSQSRSRRRATAGPGSPGGATARPGAPGYRRRG